MINHYRTLLMNQADMGNPSEYIAPNFTPITLPLPLQRFYMLLFPANTSRYYTQFLAFCYLQVLAAANQQQFVYSLDDRLTYKLSQIQDYFNVSQISNPIISNPNFPISVFGQYSVNSNTAKNYEDILISQLSTIYVSIYSKVNQVYYNQTSSSTTLTPSYQVKISSNLMNTTSDVINIATTGLSFAVAGSLVDLSEASGLNWEFTANAPFNFNFNIVYTNLLANLALVSDMLNFNPDVIDTTSLNLWNTHFNPVYRFAGLLNSYILKVNNLLQ